MAHFKLPEGSRTGTVTEFRQLIEDMKSYQRVFDALNDIEPLIDELYDNIHLFDEHVELYNSIVDLYVHNIDGQNIIKKKTKELKKEIENG